MGSIAMASAELDENDFLAVLEVLKSGRLALGPRTADFEDAMAEYIGVKHAVAVSSGTAALHLIVQSLGIGPGDEVLVPSFTFVASVNALLYVGAKPVFVDVEPETYNIDLNDLERRITRKTKAVMAVDVFGHPVDWDDLNAVAEKYGLRVIDDCCEALGAEYKGRKLGQFGNAGAFAFYPNKQITTGEGGIIVTNDDVIARMSRSLLNQGRGEMGSWLEHENLGYNYRMDEMSAALGLSQLRKLEHFLIKREMVAQMYSRRLSEYELVRTPVVKEHVRMSWFVYVVTLAPGLDRDKVMRAMETLGVPTRGYFSPVHLQPYVRRSYGITGGQLPITEDVARRTIALPFHNNLNEDEVDQVVKALKQAIEVSAE